MSEIVLISPKFEINVANSRRAAACFGASRVVVVDRRYEPATGEKGDRKPRPLRMKAYECVKVEYVSAFEPERFSGQFVIVENLAWATPLKAFEHPSDAIYIFGPEDGNVPKWIQSLAKRHVFIPSSECLNLATCAAIVLYDRSTKAS